MLTPTGRTGRIFRTVFQRLVGVECDGGGQTLLFGTVLCDGVLRHQGVLGTACGITGAGRTADTAVCAHSGTWLPWAGPFSSKSPGWWQSSAHCELCKNPWPESCTCFAGISRAEAQTL